MRIHLNDYLSVFKFKFKNKFKNFRKFKNFQEH